MHELGIMVNIIERIEQIAKEQKLCEISELILEVGELSGVLPGYLRDCYPAAAYDTPLQNTKLIIENIPGIVICIDCKHTYRFLENSGGCPKCNSSQKETLSGNQLNIKHIKAR